MNVVCPICQNEKTSYICEENNYKGYKCKKCNLVFIANKPSMDELNNYYINKSDESVSKNKNTTTKEITATNTLKIINKYKKSGNLLEMGPGWGLLLELAKDIGYQVTALEVNPKQIAYLKNKKIDVIEGLIEEELGKIYDNSFDIIFSRDVLSHMYEPEKNFINMNRILKDDGIVVFETGNYGEINKFWFKLMDTYDYPEHLFFFAEKSIKYILNKTGFKLIKKYRISTVPYILINKIFKKKKAKTKQISNNETKRRKQNKTILMLFFSLLKILGFLMPKSFPTKDIYVVRKG